MSTTGRRNNIGRTVQYIKMVVSSVPVAHRREASEAVVDEMERLWKLDQAHGIKLSGFNMKVTLKNGRYVATDLNRQEHNIKEVS